MDRAVRCLRDSRYEVVRIRIWHPLVSLCRGSPLEMMRLDDLEKLALPRPVHRQDVQHLRYDLLSIRDFPLWIEPMRQRTYC